jgi:drug/metabolite transporter (DMT)-like permease
VSVPAVRRFRPAETAVVASSIDASIRRRASLDLVGAADDDLVMPSTRPDSASSVSTTDLALLVYLGAVWGAAFLFFRIASPELGALWTAEARVVVAGVALAVFAGRSAWRAARRQPIAFLVVGATFSAIPFTLLAFATISLPASLASLIMATTPLFTAIVSAAWLRQRLTRGVAIGLGVGFGAEVFLLGGSPIAIGPMTVLAFAAGLGAALSYAFAGTFVKRRLGDVAPLDLATGQLVAAALILLPVALASGIPSVPSPAAIGSILAMGIVSTAIAWPVFFRISRRTTATAASSSTFVVPMFGILWGGLVLGEHVGVELLLGFALVIVSLVLVLRLPVPRTASLRPSLGRIVARSSAAIAAATR